MLARAFLKEETWFQSLGGGELARWCKRLGTHSTSNTCIEYLAWNWWKLNNFCHWLKDCCGRHNHFCGRDPSRLKTWPGSFTHTLLLAPLNPSFEWFLGGGFIAAHRLGKLTVLWQRKRDLWGECLVFLISRWFPENLYCLGTSVLLGKWAACLSPSAASAWFRETLGLFLLWLNIFFKAISEFQH